MKLLGSDLLLLGLGSLLFVGAGVPLTMELLKAGPEETSSVGLFNVRFIQTPLPGETRDVSGMDSVTETFPVDARNVTRVRVDVACSDPASAVGSAAPYAITINVAGPSGLSGQRSAGCSGTNGLDILVVNLPTNETVRASTLDDARRVVDEDPNATRAMGDWTVTVTGSRNGQTSPLDQVEPTGSIRLAPVVWRAEYDAINPPPQK